MGSAWKDPGANLDARAVSPQKTSSSGHREMSLDGASRPSTEREVRPREEQ